ncbi:DNA (cytosine-5)-methyltransferase 1 [Prevotellaceae bacterium MN60]|nr:DNA (cytosine-5)-methyltransferase 1 [Prevotellaceae bacterium MN60]
MAKEVIKFIDLFAGIGGIRLGLELALRKAGYTPKCVFTSEIKEHAIKVLKQNHPKDKITGDITKVEASTIPDFDILCGGFPCQAFSAAGNRDGFADTRGTLFFDVERIILEKKPKGFILENVEGLVNHDGGNTLEVILSNLDAADYWVSYKVLNSIDFGVPQERKRIYIIGIRKDLCDSPISLEKFPQTQKKLGKILESGKPTSDSPFVKLLLEKFTVEELSGKAIKDKRGGTSNIHSWDLELKGPVTDEEKRFLNLLLTERRKKKWADIIGIKWMDGMPLTKSQIEDFYQNDNLQEMLDDLTAKGYVRYEHPKKQITEKHIAPNGKVVTTSRRISDTTKPKGYNIVAGKLSYEVGKILSPKEVAPTLVATDMQHLYVIDNGGLRTLTLREGLRLFGYPESFKFDIDEANGFDLLGNTVVVPVIKAVATRLVEKL